MKQFYNPYLGLWMCVSEYYPDTIFNDSHWSDTQLPGVPVINPNDSKLNIKVTNNFCLHELVCKCGCGSFAHNKKFMDRLQSFRSAYGHPITLNSATRCFPHNMQEGGSATSDHLTGDGVDPACTTSKQRYKMIRLAYQAGFDRLGVGNGFIHIGVGAPEGANVKDVLWLY